MDPCDFLILGQIMERRCVCGWCLFNYKCDELITMFMHQTDRSRRSNVIPFGSKTTQAVLNPGGPAPVPRDSRAA